MLTDRKLCHQVSTAHQLSVLLAFFSFVQIKLVTLSFKIIDKTASFEINFFVLFTIVLTVVMYVKGISFEYNFHVCPTDVH